MSMSTRSQFRVDVGTRLVEVRAEQVISIARLALVLLSLAAVQSEGFIAYNAALHFILSGYLFYSLLTLGLVSRGRTNPFWRKVTYLVDFGVVAALLSFTDGATSPFFVYFTFLLLSATFLWHWRGAIVTTLALSAVLWTLALFHPASLDAELDRVILREGYLVIIGIMLAYVGAHREWSRERFANLAAWSATETDKGIFKINLAYAAQVLGASRMLCIWQCAGEVDQHVLHFEDGRTEYLREPAVLPMQEVIKPAPGSAVYIGQGPEQHSFVIDPTVRTKYRLGAAAIAPLTNKVYRGYVFALRSHRDDDLLPIATIVADRIGTEIERDWRRRKLQLAAVNRERARMARNIHDGVLQALTATALKLKLCAQNADPQTGTELEKVRHNLAEEQARVRRLIENARLPVEGTSVASEGRKLLAELGAYWNCEIVLQVDSAAAEISAELAGQVQLIFAEAVANAARHGGASRVAIELRCDGEKLILGIEDNGSGFSGLNGTYSDEVIATLAVYPHSIYERVKEMGGKMNIWSSTGGARLKIQLPVPWLQAA